jgi:hypothetical protein
LNSSIFCELVGRGELLTAGHGNDEDEERGKEAADEQEKPSLP